MVISHKGLSLIIDCTSEPIFLELLMVVSVSQKKRCGIFYVWFQGLPNVIMQPKTKPALDVV